MAIRVRKEPVTAVPAATALPIVTVRTVEVMAVAAVVVLARRDGDVRLASAKRVLPASRFVTEKPVAVMGVAAVVGAAMTDCCARKRPVCPGPVWWKSNLCIAWSTESVSHPVHPTRQIRAESVFRPFLSKKLHPFPTGCRATTTIFAPWAMSALPASVFPVLL